MIVSVTLHYILCYITSNYPVSCSTKIYVVLFYSTMVVGVGRYSSHTRCCNSRRGRIGWGRTGAWCRSSRVQVLAAASTSRTSRSSASTTTAAVAVVVVVVGDRLW